MNRTTALLIALLANACAAQELFDVASDQRELFQSAFICVHLRLQLRHLVAQPHPI